MNGTAFFDRMVEYNDTGGTSSMCIVCKGARAMCGKDRCPLMIKFYSQSKTVRVLDSTELEGSSPPAVSELTHILPPMLCRCFSSSGEG